MPDYGRSGRPIADESEYRVLRERQRDMAQDAERVRLARRATGAGWWSRLTTRLFRRR